MAEIARAELGVIPSFKGGYKSISKQFGPISERSGHDAGKRFGGGMESGIGGVAGKVFAPLAAAVGGLAIGSWFKGAVDQASDLNEAGTALGAVFGDASSEIDKFAAAGAGALGQTELAVKNAAQTFGVYGKAAGLANDANATFSTELVGLSTDLASFYNADPSEVVEALGAGLRGEAEPLRRFGILLDDATLKAKALELGIYDGNGSLSQQQKILASQAVIMEQSSIAQGDFAKTSGGLANQQRILSATWDNFAGKIGGVLLPAVTAVVTKMNELAGPVFDRITAGAQSAGDLLSRMFGGIDATSVGGILEAVQGAIGKVIEALPGLVAEFVPTMVEGIISRYEMIIEAFTGIVTALVAMMPTLLPTILNGAVALFQGLITALTVVVPMLLQAVLGLLPSLITTLLGMLPALIAAALSLFQTLIQAVITITPVLIQTLVDLLPVILESLLGMLPMLIEGALALFLGIVTGLSEIIPTLIQAAIDLLPVVVSTLISLIPALIDGAFELFTGIVDALPEIIPDLIQALVDLGPQMVDTIIGLVPQLFGAGKAIIQGLLDGAGSLLKSIGSFFLDMLPGWIVGPFKAALGINSPSKVFEGLGENIGEGALRGIGSMQRPVQAAMRSLAEPPALASSFASGAALAGRVDHAPAAPASAAGGVPRIEVPVIVNGREIARAVREADRSGR